MRHYYEHNVSETYRRIKRQPGFWRNDGAVIRRIMREIGGKRRAVAPEPDFPGHDRTMRRRTRYSAPEWARVHPSWIITSDFSELNLCNIAKRLEFSCPFCGSNENPFRPMDMWFPERGTIVCRECHETKFGAALVELKSLSRLANLLRKNHA